MTLRASELREKLADLCLHKPCSLAALVEETGSSMRTVYRHLGEIRKDSRYEVLRSGSKGDVLYTVKKREE